jgi:hypothetical protein
MKRRFPVAPLTQRNEVVAYKSFIINIKCGIYLSFTLTFRQLPKGCSTQPGLFLKKSRYGTMTHDCKRNGTTTLLAALETVQGKVIGQCY